MLFVGVSFRDHECEPPNKWSQKGEQCVRLLWIQYRKSPTGDQSCLEALNNENPKKTMFKCWKMPQKETTRFSLIVGKADSQQIEGLFLNKGEVVRVISKGERKTALLIACWIRDVYQIMWNTYH